MLRSAVTLEKGGFRVGPVTVDPPLLLAPMEDVSNLAFRLIAKEIGRPGLMFTEFVSSMAAHFNPEIAKNKMRVHPAERPLAIQIFGGDAGIMAECARIAEEMGADVVDINMGCWVPKVCRTGSGAALLKGPATAVAIVRSVVRAVTVPVSVKVRAGWDYSEFAAPELARRFQDEGAQMITLHARFARQGFEGEADWRLIEALRTALSVPLVGNGDVREPADAARMMRETGCDGVMVGRIAISNPWALARIRAALAGETEPDQPSIHERIAVALRHVRLMIAFEAGEDSFEAALTLDPALLRQAEARACRRLRGQIPLYAKAVPGAAQIRDRLTRCSTYEEYESQLCALAAGAA
jgi:nifR3 family TIM-barrel protein